MSEPHLSRRAFHAAALATLALGRAAHRAEGRQRQPARAGGSDPRFTISLAQWSLHRTIRAGELDPLDFPRVARERYGIRTVELVNQFFADRARDGDYLRQMRRRADDAGVDILLVMCDGVGDLGDPDAAARGRAVDGHVRWLEAAATLGCHSIRVNAASRGTDDEQRALAVDGLRRIATLAIGHELNVLVENHGGRSSNGAWLASVLEEVGLGNCGSLPDFGNFCMDWSRAGEEDAWYDRYRGVEELMPFAKAVSAKSHDFDERGHETATDFLRMMRIVHASGYRGPIGIEYEGARLSEHDGILATKRLLERVFDQL